MQALGNLGGGLSAGASAAGQGLSTAATAVADAAKTAGSAVGDAATGAVNAVKGALPSAPNLAAAPTWLQKAAPYFSDFLQGEGLAGNMLSQGLGISPEQLKAAGVATDTGIFGDLLRTRSGAGAIKGAIGGGLSDMTSKRTPAEETPDAAAARTSGFSPELEGMPAQDHGLIGGLINEWKPATTEVQLGQNRPSKVGSAVDMFLKAYGIPLQIGQEPASARPYF